MGIDHSVVNVVVGVGAGPCEGDFAAVETGNGEVGGNEAGLVHRNVINKRFARIGSRIFEGDVMAAACVAAERHRVGGVRGGKRNGLTHLRECAGICRVGHHTDGHFASRRRGQPRIERHLVLIQCVGIIHFGQNSDHFTTQCLAIHHQMIVSIVRFVIIIACDTYPIATRVVDDSVPAIIEIAEVFKTIIIWQQHGFALGFDDGGGTPNALVAPATNGTYI